MRIILSIHQRLNPDSGSAGVTWHLRQSFRTLGHSAAILSFDDLSTRIPKVVRPIIFPEYVALRLGHLTAGRQVDVIDASASDSWVWGAVRSRRSSGPLLVARTHGLAHIRYSEMLTHYRAGTMNLNLRQRLLYPGGLRLWEVAKSLRQADLTLYLNGTDLDYAVKNLGVDPEKARVISNGVPDTFLDLPVVLDGDQGGQSIRIAQIGRYSQPKGVSFGSAALNNVLRRHPNVRVTFAGTGAPPENVLGGFDPAVRGRIEVRPRYERSELPAILEGHQIKLFPTLQEGFGMALVEAMACGLAPVATMTGGPREIVQDEVNGLLVPPRDSEAIETALERLIADPGLLARLRRNAYESAQAYPWRRIAERTISLYEEAIERKNERA
jgi:glycosyltransferase involved in cell wall biosynthesis